MLLCPCLLQPPQWRKSFWNKFNFKSWKVLFLLRLVHFSSLSLSCLCLCVGPTRNISCKTVFFPETWRNCWGNAIVKTESVIYGFPTAAATFISKLNSSLREPKDFPKLYSPSDSCCWLEVLRVLSTWLVPSPAQSHFSLSSCKWQGLIYICHPHNCGS